MARLAQGVVQRAGLEWEQVVHVMVGSPGVFDRHSGRLLFSQ